MPSQPVENLGKVRESSRTGENPQLPLESLSFKFYIVVKRIESDETDGKYKGDG